jgi:hypothetical protein
VADDDVPPEVPEQHAHGVHVVQYNQHKVEPVRAGGRGRGQRCSLVSPAPVNSCCSAAAVLLPLLTMLAVCQPDVVVVICGWGQLPPAPAPAQRRVEGHRCDCEPHQLAAVEGVLLLQGGVALVRRVVQRDDCRKVWGWRERDVGGTLRAGRREGGAARRWFCGGRRNYSEQPASRSCRLTQSAADDGHGQEEADANLEAPRHDLF